MKKNENIPVAGAVLSASVLIGLLITLFSMAVFSTIILFGGLREMNLAVLADCCLALGSFSAAFLTARRMLSWQPLWGLGAGSILFGCLVILSLAWFGEPMRIMRVLVNAILTVVCAALGGTLGVKRHKRKKHRK